MIKQIVEMPAGTIGVEFGGEESRKEDRVVLGPALEQAVEAGEVSLLLQTAPDFDGMDIDARIEDARTWVAVG